MKISIRRPDDFHVHLREGFALAAVTPHTSRTFARALVMPNTDMPILTAKDAKVYAEQIVSGTSGFEPLMTIQLVESTTPEIIRQAKASGVTAAKYYPRGATTNSENGVRNLLDLGDALAAMEECGLVLCLHGEVPGVFCMERERQFLQFILMPLSRSFPKLQIVFEHASTADAVGYVENLPDNVAATITVHHMMLTLDDIIGDKLRPHHFCKPIAKTPVDKAALRRAATSGNPKFFLGTDSAPHLSARKECAEGCAGIFSAPVAMEALTQIFEEEGRLETLEVFSSEHGARFYGLPLNAGHLTLEKTPFSVPERVQGGYIPFLAGTAIGWSAV